MLRPLQRILAQRILRAHANYVWCCSAAALLSFLLLTAVAYQVVYAQEPSPEFDLSQVTPPTSPPLALAGQAIYQQNCAPCHGTQGMGDGPTAAQLPSPATAFADPAAVWERSPAQLFHTAKFGRVEKLMPPWQNQLDDTQIWQAVAYAWSLHTNQRELATGADLYAQSCANCHGVEGAGDGPEATTDLMDFTDLTYAMSRSQADWQAGWQNAHPEVGADWTPDQQRQVLETIRAFSYTPPWANPYEPGSGVITGTVTQGTPGGAAVAGLTAALEAYVNFTPVTAFTTTVDSAGVFTFTALSTDANIDYLVSVASEEIRYTSPILKFTPEQSQLQTGVAIYGTTDDGSGLHVERLHWIIDPRPGALVVGEVLSFSNNGDRTFIGKPITGTEQVGTVALRVPADAQELTFENGELGGRFQQVGDLVYDTTPVVPGQGARQLIMRYFLPHEGGSYDFQQAFLYPIDQMTILVAELPQLQVDIPGFALASRETLQGQTYQLWQPEGTAPTEVTVQLAGLLQPGDADPRTAAQSDGAQQAGATTSSAVVPLLTAWAPWSMGILVVVALVGVAIWSMQQRRAGGQDRLQELHIQRDDLIRRIAHLDDQHAIQDIDDAAWQRERAQLKAQLLYVTNLLAQQQTDKRAPA
ncbi:MAG: hypothetical protein DYG89_01495 [Caldilinea sp. CFX5]|nr:hypothetical protein [Caldilinea sp. CFX5]